MYRRRAKGMGIVLRYCDDVGDHIGEDAQTVLEVYKEFAVKIGVLAILLKSLFVKNRVTRI